MRKFLKILAVVIAVIMLATMATACKEEEDDDDFGTAEVGGKTGKTGADTDAGEENGGGNEGDSNDVSGSGDTGNEGSGSGNGGSGGNGGNGGSGSGSGGNGGSEGSGSSAKDNKNPSGGQDEKEHDVIVENYDETKKYDADNNPLIAESKKPNTGVQPSFDIDTTGFVRNGIKIADLKGKKLYLITSEQFGSFRYKGTKGESLNEWHWFESIKGTYGCNVIYYKDDARNAYERIMAYMNAGKTLDLICTHVQGFPMYLGLSQSIEPYINVQNLGNSPGVDKMTLEETRWAGSYRCMAPIGAVNVIWYNKSMVDEFRLKDPHTLWQNGQWDWNAWAAFVKSVPAQNSAGEKLYAYGQCNTDATYSWPLTNGVQPIAIDTSSKEPALINNWKNEKVREAWNFYATTFKSAQCGGSFWGLWDGTTMMHDAENLQSDNWDNPYCNTHLFDWVPYPKAPTDTGRCIAFNYGYSMIIPKKVKSQANIPYAVKFAELWCTRFTEALFDYLATATWIQFDYARRKEYFQFAVNNNYFGVQMQDWLMLTGDDYTAMFNFRWALENDQLNILTEATKVENLVEKAIQFCLEFGS